MTELADDKPQVGGEPPHKSESALVTFLYLICRDLVQPGLFEKYVLQAQPADLTNRFLGEYAENAAKRLVGENLVPYEELDAVKVQLQHAQDTIGNQEEQVASLITQRDDLLDAVRALEVRFDQVDMKPDIPWQEDQGFEDAVRGAVALAR